MLNKLVEDSKLEGPGKRNQYCFSKRQHCYSYGTWQLEKWAHRKLVEFKLFEEEYGQGKIINLIVHLWILNQVWPLWSSYLGFSNTLWKHQLSANCWSKTTIKFEELSGERGKKTKPVSITVLYKSVWDLYLESHMWFCSWFWRRL